MAAFGIAGARSARADSLLRWILAGLFVATAAAKIVGFAAFRDALAASGGLLEPISSLAAAGVVLFELITAVCLFTRDWRAVGGALAALLATGFALWNNRLARSGSAGCGCLGTWMDAKPAEMLPLDGAILCAGLLTFWINAAGTGADETPPPPRQRALRAWYPHLALGYCLFVALAFQARTASRVRQGYGPDWPARAVAVTGSVAPAFRLPTADGGWFGTRDMPGRRTLLCFLSLDCETCLQIAPMLEAARLRFGERCQIVAVVPTRSGSASCERAATALAAAGWNGVVLCDPRSAVTALYGDGAIQWPAAVLVGPAGTVLAVRRDAAFAVDGFLVRLADSSGDAGGPTASLPPNSAPMPDAEVVTLDGERVRLSALWRGRSLVLSFLKAGCGNCTTRLLEVEAACGGREDALVVHLLASRRDARTLDERLRPSGLVAICSPALLRALAAEPPVTVVVWEGGVRYRAGAFSQNALVRTLDACAKVQQ